MNSIPNPNYEFGHPLVSDFTEHTSKGIVGVIMGSRSDWPFMQPCTNTLEELKVPFEFGVVSAHRTTERMMGYARLAYTRGLQVLITCAGGSAHLPGMIASDTLLPTLGVAPLKTDKFAVDSMIAMPEGKPLAYLGGGSSPGKNAGAVNAALMAASILALNDSALYNRLDDYHIKLQNDVPFTCF